MTDHPRGTVALFDAVACPSCGKGHSLCTGLPIDWSSAYVYGCPETRAVVRVSLPRAHAYSASCPGGAVCLGRVTEAAPA